MPKPIALEFGRKRPEKDAELADSIKQLRQKKEGEEKFKELETAKKTKFVDDLSKKQSSQEVQKLLKSITGFGLDDENLLVKLRASGYRMTFDHEGAPILQKPSKHNNELITNPVVALKGPGPKSRPPKPKSGSLTRSRTELAQYSARSETLELPDSRETHNQQVIEFKPSIAASSMVVAAGVEHIEKGNVISGGPFTSRGRFSVNDFRKIKERNTLRSAVVNNRDRKPSGVH